MKKFLTLAAIAVTTLFVAVPASQAGIRVGIGIGIPICYPAYYPAYQAYYAAPAYYAPAQAVYGRPGYYARYPHRVYFGGRVVYRGRVCR